MKNIIFAMTVIGFICPISSLSAEQLNLWKISKTCDGGDVNTYDCNTGEKLVGHTMAGVNVLESSALAPSPSLFRSKIDPDEQDKYNECIERSCVEPFQVEVDVETQPFQQFEDAATSFLGMQPTSKSLAIEGKTDSGGWFASNCRLVVFREGEYFDITLMTRGFFDDVMRYQHYRGSGQIYANSIFLANTGNTVQVETPYYVRMTGVTGKSSFLIHRVSAGTYYVELKEVASNGYNVGKACTLNINRQEGSGG